jgi:hypothetical protein
LVTVPDNAFNAFLLCFYQHCGLERPWRGRPAGARVRCCAGRMPAVRCAQALRPASRSSLQSPDTWHLTPVFSCAISPNPSSPLNRSAAWRPKEKEYVPTDY